MLRSLRFLSCCALMLTGLAVSAEETQMDLVIVAGQSNAVGYHAKPSELPASEVDQEIRFWWRTGDPPPDEHDSVSSQKWTHLQPQPLGNPKLPKEGRQYGNFAQADGGFGPEIGLARTIYQQEKKTFAVIKVAFSGTNLQRDWSHTDPGAHGQCYQSLISETQAAIAAAKEQGITLRPRAFAWIQGESDANASDAPKYARTLGEMVESLRAELNAPQLIALVAVNTKFGNGTKEFMPEIVAQQQRMSAADPRAVYVDTSHATIANSAHFDTKGTLEVGRLMAEALFTVESKLSPAQPVVRIVTLGDSITKGVRSGVKAEQTFASLLESKLNAEGTSAKVFNVGIGGERTDQALKRLNDVIDLKPDYVTVMYGTNDSYVDKGKTASRISVEAYRENLNQIVSRLLELGITPVLMTEPRWADGGYANGIGEHPNLRLTPYMQACREVAQAWRVPLVDHFQAWTVAKEKGTHLKDWTTDGCHPNPTGHAEIAQEVLPVLQQAIGPVVETRKKILSGEPVRVICFGDSVTGVYYHTGSRRAYTDMLGIALNRVSPESNVEMINAGISGHTTVNALARIDRDVLSHKPDLVTVMFGLNDMTRVPLEEYQANLKEIVKKCRDVGAEVVLATPNAVTDSPGRPTDKLIQYCDVVRAVAKELNVPLADCYRELAALRRNSDFGWQMLMSDAIHPNMAGHKKMATALTQSITGLRVSLDDVPPPTGPLQHTVERLKTKQPIRVLAMAPVAELIGPSLNDIAAGADVQIESWKVEGMTLAEIENDARAKVRKMKPDLVVIAVPKSATAESDEAFIYSYAWIMNLSLNFGAPTWDCVVVHPSVLDPDAAASGQDLLVRQLVQAQDLSLIDRGTGENEAAASLIRNWIQAAAKSAK
ncbi:GDSL-type esterase/lipase family protein [Thalassoglobus polymorphus]|uniref:Arylesterase n=1 Tax=Thalassoglobus polymorphus TaxID=2527994 RepID=A0A517QPF5_9PLAN|nr:GDSL-type esterase/lipase family protein [Thalassoglobus polymorphus]QDT33505.1 Arylesterase precursor [Thalassoglobus polymorphus]